MSVDTKVVLLALLDAILIAAGVFFQKLNGTRAASVWASPLLLVSFLCFAPTFFLANIAYAMGGRVSLFVPVTAVCYVMILAVGRFIFGEAIGPPQLFGCLLILAGVALTART